MKKQQAFSFYSAADGLEIHGIYQVCENACKGVIAIVHGMAEHKERYLDFMKVLAQHGYSSVIHDHRGHGKSIKDKNDLGYFYDDGANALVSDIHQVIIGIRKHNPNIPVILFGHSMGSLLVRAFIKRFDNDIDALVVCGSPSKNNAAGIAKALTKTMMKIKGDHYRSALIQKLAFGSYNAGFEEKDSGNIWLCSDHDVVKAYDDDPLCGFTFTLNGFETLFTVLMDVYDKHGWNIQNYALPILFIAGAKDPCIVNEKKFQEAIDFLKKQGYVNIDSHLFEGKRHEILNETNKREVYQYMIQWMNHILYRAKQQRS